MGDGGVSDGDAVMHLRLRLRGCCLSMRCCGAPLVGQTWTEERGARLRRAGHSRELRLSRLGIGVEVVLMMS